MAWRGIFRECYFFFVGSPFISFLYSSRKMTGRTLSSSASLRRRFIFHGFAELSCCVPQSGCRTFFLIKKTHLTIAILCNAPAAAIDRRMSDPSSRNRKPPDSIFFFWLSPAARPRFSKRKKMEANEVLAPKQMDSPVSDRPSSGLGNKTEPIFFSSPPNQRDFYEEVVDSLFFFYLLPDQTWLRRFHEPNRTHPTISHIRSFAVVVVFFLQVRTKSLERITLDGTKAAGGAVRRSAG